MTSNGQFTITYEQRSSQVIHLVHNPMYILSLVENIAKKNRSRFPIAVLLTTMTFSR